MPEIRWVVGLIAAMYICAWNMPSWAILWSWWAVYEVLSQMNAQVHT